MKLFYFDLTGRAEPIRIMFKLAGTDFEDVRFSFQEWGEKFKALSPTGQSPWLELDDGSTLAQSNAIYYYVARLTGFLPDEPMAQARVLELSGVMEDVGKHIENTFSMPPEEKVAARQAAISPGGKMYDAMMAMDKMLAASTTEYYLSDELGVADIQIFCTYNYFCSGFLDGLTKEHLAQFPSLTALRNKVATHPKVKAIYADTELESFKPF